MLTLPESLEKLKSELQLADQKRNKDLIQLVQQALDQLPQAPVVAVAGASEQQGETKQWQSERLAWDAFKQCLQPQLAIKVRETALDLLQKLFASAALRGWEQLAEPLSNVGEDANSTLNEDANITNNGGTPVISQATLPSASSSSSASREIKRSYPPLVIDDIIQSICLASPLSSFNDPSPTAPETAVHLQIIKALLTAVTCQSCHVHETSLLKSIQACINIWMYSKNMVNQTTAKACLTQMVHSVFARMEQSYDAGSGEVSSVSATELYPLQSSAELGPSPSAAFVSPSTADGSSMQEDIQNPYFASKKFISELLQRDAFLTMRFLYRLAIKVDKLTQPSSGAGKPTATGNLDDLSPLTVKTRAIALEMILLLLNNAGPVLQTKEPFITLIKQNITIVISKNGLSTHMILYELALSNFLILIKTFKDILKAEIEVLFNEIYLYIMDNPHALFKQKLLILTGLYKICSNPQILADIYLNYDCDLGMVSIFERILSSLEKTAKGTGVKINASGGPVGVFGVPDTQNISAEAQQEKKLRAKALRCLTAISVSLSEWMKESPVGNGISIVVAGQTAQLVALESSRSSNSSAVSEVQSTVVSPNAIPNIIQVKNAVDSVTLSEGSKSSKNLNDFSNLSMSNVVDAPEDIEKIKSKKIQWKQGISLFNTSPNKGVKALRENGFLTDPASIISFLKTTSELDKKAIGDFLGDGNEENINIMHMFVDTFDFKDVEFTTAIRRFLQAFRLPGEAQKIDRIMETFAARYCENNPKIFAKADTAYTLAFSIMMLNTDLHSPRIKNRMTKQDFIRNNRGINDNGDLPEELLSRLYEDIEKNEIILEEERAVKELEKMLAGGMLTNGQDAELTRRELFKRDTKRVEKKSQNMMKKGKDKPMTGFKSATHIDHARLMFEIVWAPLISSLSTTFEECVADNLPVDDDYLKGFESVINQGVIKDLVGGDTNADVIYLCLQGFDAAIKIACCFRLNTERDAFISSLGKLTSLSDITFMKAKNVAAAKILLGLTFKLGNYLEKSWKSILQCISDMDKWKIIGEGSVLEDLEPAPSSDSQKNRLKRSGSQPLSPSTDELKTLFTRRPSLQKLTSQFSSQSMAITIDKIFATSVNLDGSSIVHFFRALCEISLYELEASRVYSLQKVVEISYYNLGRIRLEWSHIWRVLTIFFNNVGSHPNAKVANFAVDSLRQLGMKFLVRGELAHFNINNEFLKPFEHIIRHTKHQIIRELTISSIEQMVTARSKSIKSGWRSVFVIMSRVAAEQTDEQLVRHAFNFISQILPNYWEDYKEYLVDYANCAVDFALVDSEFQLKSGKLIVDGAIQLLFDATAKLSESTLSSNESVKLIDDDFFLKWFPILSGLSRIQRDSTSASIRARALDTFFELLQHHGRRFSFKNKHWKTVIKSVILPLFDDLKIPMAPVEREENASVNSEQETFQMESWQSAIWTQALKRMIEIYSFYFNPESDNADCEQECFKNNPELVIELLDLILMLIKRKSPNLAQTGIIYMSEFVTRNAEKFDDHMWNVVVHFIEKIFHESIPVEMLQFPTSSVTKKRHMTDVAADNEAALIASIDVPHAIMKCGTHLLVLEFVRDLCLSKDDPAIHIIKGAPQALNRLNELDISVLPSGVLQKLPLDLQQRLLSCLHASFSFANSFNNNYDLRLALWKSGSVPQMPYLIKQESTAISIYLSVIFHMYRLTGDLNAPSAMSPTQDEAHSEFENILRPSTIQYRRKHDFNEAMIEEMFEVLDKFIHFHLDVHKYQKEIQNWTSVICLVWKEILTVPWGKSRQQLQKGVHCDDFKKHIPVLFKLAVKMMVFDRCDEIRECIKEFMERLASTMDQPEFMKLL